MRAAFLALLLAVALVLAPQAFARMGSGHSYGSRASRTYDRPMERSYTPRPVQPPPSYGSRPAAPTGGGFFGHNPFLGGFLGGLLGVGLLGRSGLGGVFGLILQLALLFFAVRWLLRLVRGLGAAPAGAPPPAAARPVRAAKEFEPTDTDKQAFGQILVAMQQAWSAGDLNAMRRLATPEVVSLLADDLADNASRGVRNIVDQVQLLRGEVSEAWREGGKEFATATLTFLARDFSLGPDGTMVVDGNPHVPVQSSEAWTFVRAAGGGGQWLLSAVER